MTTLLAICHTHDLSWDVDVDQPKCSCDDTGLLVFEDQEELPFYGSLDG